MIELAKTCQDADILVNNAGDISSGPLHSLSDADWRKGFNLKVFGYVTLTREMYSYMKQRGAGVIVNDIGNSGENWDANYIAGSTGNAALMSFTKALGGVSLNDGVRVVGVNPGPVATDRVGARRQIDQTRPVEAGGPLIRRVERSSRQPDGNLIRHRPSNKHDRRRSREIGPIWQVIFHRRIGRSIQHEAEGARLTMLCDIHDGSIEIRVGQMRRRNEQLTGEGSLHVHILAHQNTDRSRCEPRLTMSGSD